MLLKKLPVLSHPKGESYFLKSPPEPALKAASLPVDTLGPRIHVEWDPQSPVTPMGQLVFFTQFLAAGGLYSDWIARCPLSYKSPNAPEVADVLGTWTLAILSGASRYAHVTALRGDTVNPQGLGMKKVVSEDSLRRAFQDQDAQALARWQTGALQAAFEPALEQPWICDLDVTVKPIYGHQEGAQIGYNPHKPGRPCHAYHTLFLRTLRLALDVEVRPGKEHAPKYGLTNAWKVIDKLAPNQRPWLLCGDSAYGNEEQLLECEKRQQAYLFRQRQTSGVKQLIVMLERQGGCVALPDGREGCEGWLQLTGWTRKRRVIVTHRRSQSRTPAKPLLLPLMADGITPLAAQPQYEYEVLATNLAESISAVVHLYRQRADAENAYDELKNQWGWGGFMTKDLLRCQVAARMGALVYNWWTLFVRCAEPKRAREAITSRPLLLFSVGRIIKSAGQKTLILTSSHAEASYAQNLLTGLSLFLSGLKNSAEQLDASACWRRIWQRILEPFLHPVAALPGSSP